MTTKETSGRATLILAGNTELSLGEVILRISSDDHHPQVATVYVCDTGELPHIDVLRARTIRKAIVVSRDGEYVLVFKSCRWESTFNQKAPETLHGALESLTVTEWHSRTDSDGDTLTEVSYFVSSIRSLDYHLGWYRHQVLDRILDVENITKNFSRIGRAGEWTFRYAPAVVAVAGNNHSEPFELVIRHGFTFFLQNEPAPFHALLATEHIAAMMLEVLGLIDNTEYSPERIRIDLPGGKTTTVYKSIHHSNRPQSPAESADIADVLKLTSSIVAAILAMDDQNRLRTVVAMRRLVRSGLHQERAIKAMHYHAALSYLLEILSPHLMSKTPGISLVETLHSLALIPAAEEVAAVTEFEEYRSKVVRNGFGGAGKQQSDSMVADILPIIGRAFSRVCKLGPEGTRQLISCLRASYRSLPFDEDIPAI